MILCICLSSIECVHYYDSLQALSYFFERKSVACNIYSENRNDQIVSMARTNVDSKVID